MDKIDRRILAELQSDGNITNLELADKGRTVALALRAQGKAARGEWCNRAHSHATQPR
jgi:DNA-binding Lrp family transcriptional regulator